MNVFVCVNVYTHTRIHIQVQVLFTYIHVCEKMCIATFTNAIFKILHYIRCTLSGDCKLYKMENRIN